MHAPTLLLPAYLISAALGIAVPNTSPLSIPHSPLDALEPRSGSLERRQVPDAVKFKMWPGTLCYDGQERDYTRSDVTCHAMPSGQAMDVYFIHYSCRVFIYEWAQCTGYEAQLRTLCVGVSGFRSMRIFCY